MPATGTRVSLEYQHRVSAPPHVVHPLLCPVREREWIPGWRCDVVYSQSGVAEDGAIFLAGLEGRPLATFFVTRFEPPRAIAYLVLSGPDVADRLDLALEEDRDGGAIVHWTRAYTALTQEGRRLAGEMAAAFEARVPQLAALLERHAVAMR